MPPITHRVRLHFVSIATTSVPIATHIKNVKAIYAQYGIQVVERSGMSLMLSGQDAARFTVVDGQCEWTITAGEYSEIQNLGNHVPATDIAVYYVQQLAGGNIGCGGHAPDRPACIVASSGTQWTTAHEIGHVLLGSGFRPVHENSTANLMHSPTGSITASLPVLTAAQIAQIKRSPCCTAVRSR